jgi:hypothetical protein
VIKNPNQLIKKTWANLKIETWGIKESGGIITQKVNNHAIEDLVDSEGGKSSTAGSEDL